MIYYGLKHKASGVRFVQRQSAIVTSCTVAQSTGTQHAARASRTLRARRGTGRGAIAAPGAYQYTHPFWVGVLSSHIVGPGACVGQCAKAKGCVAVPEGRAHCGARVKGCQADKIFFSAGGCCHKSLLGHLGPHGSFMSHLSSTKEPP